MPQLARYTILVPKTDSGHTALEMHKALAGAKDARIEHSFIEPDRFAHNPGEDPQLHDFVVAYAEDNPEHDSHIKQLARSGVKAMGIPALYVLKEGRDGIAHWAIDNPDVLAGQPGTDGALDHPGGQGVVNDHPAGVGGAAPEPLAAHGATVDNSDSHRKKAITWHERAPKDMALPLRKRMQDGIWQFNVGMQAPEAVERWLAARGLGGDVHHGVGVYDGKAEPSSRLTFYNTSPKKAYDIWQMLCQDFPAEESFGVIAPGAAKSNLLFNPNSQGATSLPPEANPWQEPLP